MSFLKKIFLLIIALMIIFYLIWQNEDFQRKYVYPYPFRQTIEFYADRYDVDKNLVAGVILAESKFQKEAVSSHGAKGLMQIMPETAIWIASQIEDEEFIIEDLYNPKINIKYGTWYISSLQDEFAGNKIFMLSAYNAGRGNVHEWIEKYGWDKDFTDYEKIPYPETREYVKKVLANEQQYQRLYK